MSLEVAFVLILAALMAPMAIVYAFVPQWRAVRILIPPPPWARRQKPARPPSAARSNRAAEDNGYKYGLCMNCGAAVCGPSLRAGLQCGDCGLFNISTDQQSQARAREIFRV